MLGMCLYHCKKGNKYDFCSTFLCIAADNLQGFENPTNLYSMGVIVGRIAEQIDLGHIDLAMVNFELWQEEGDLLHDLCLNETDTDSDILYTLVRESDG